MITKTVNSYVIDSNWADIYYDVVHDIYKVQGSIHYDDNNLDHQIISLFQAVYFTNGETKNFKSVEVIQLQKDIPAPQEVNHTIYVDVVDGNFNVSQEEDGTITITEEIVEVPVDSNETIIDNNETA